MKLSKKQWMCLGILAVIVIIAWVYFANKNKGTESGFTQKCPCPGVQQPGGGMYYNVACCKKATGTDGSAPRKTGVA